MSKKVFNPEQNPDAGSGEVNSSPKKYKRAGHLTDQMLRYSLPEEAPTLFDEILKPETKREIENRGSHIKEVIEGIKLTPAETKVIDCLCKLLHEKSQTSDHNKPDYYSGNNTPEIVTYGGETTPAPKLAFTLYELTKEYKGGETISGKDTANVKQILSSLGSKDFLFRYTETTTNKHGGRTEKQIEEFKKLISLVKFSQIEYSKDNIQLSSKEEIVVVLNPIFRRQINTKFIFYPPDINQRTTIAYGSHNVSIMALKLRDYLMRELTQKRYKPEITVKRLYSLLAEKWMKESRKKKVKEYTDKAIETVKKLGLITHFEEQPAKTGELKIVFYLNKEWE